MSKVIKVDNLSKIYRLGLVGRKTIAEDLNRMWARITGKEDPYLKIGETNNRAVKGKGDFVWALKDINFEVSKGERFGIIGKNGAGKSTLLKILSRIASPTSGAVKVKGRVASLLEVGTGFHPELSGRDNIFLNGSILGMTQSEIKKKFDSIVDFSGVERYIDTPVKRYSSGMYVRLAFAVAAHLEPEILIVDEVLAVGDAEFQKKCLGKMHDVSEKEGRTVLFVTHNLTAMKNLCQKTIILNNGELLSSGDTESMIKLYNELVREVKINEETDIRNKKSRRGSGVVRFTQIEVTDRDGKKNFKFNIGDTIRFKVSYKVFKEIQGLNLIIALMSGLSRECLTLVNYELTTRKLYPGETGEAVVDFENINIKPGDYPLYFEIMDSKFNEFSKDVIDDMTAPIEILGGENAKNTGFDPAKPSGFFVTPSKLIANEIQSGTVLKEVS